MQFSYQSLTLNWTLLPVIKEMLIVNKEEEEEEDEDKDKKEEEEEKKEDRDEVFTYLRR
jgi:hypothetical protein